MSAFVSKSGAFVLVNGLKFVGKMCIVGLHRCAASSTCGLIRLRLNVLALRGQPLPQRSKRTAKVFAPRDRLHSLRSPSLPRKRGTPSGAFGHAHGSRAVYGYGRAKF